MRATKTWSGVLIGVGLAVFAATLALSAPASLATLFVDFERAGVTYDSVEGRVWKGAFRRLAVDGVVIGDVAFTVSPLSLARGGVEALVVAENGAVQGSGLVAIGIGGEIRARNVSARIDLSAFRSVRALGQPLRGEATVDAMSLALSRAGRCIEAEGEVRTDAIAVIAGAYGMNGFGLAGPVACDAGDAVVAMKGGADEVAARLVVRLKPGWTVASAAALEGADPRLALALQSLGFTNDNGVWKSETGGVSVGGT